MGRWSRLSGFYRRIRLPTDEQAHRWVVGCVDRIQKIIRRQKMVEFGGYLRSGWVIAKWPIKDGSEVAVSDGCKESTVQRKENFNNLNKPMDGTQQCGWSGAWISSSTSTTLLVVIIVDN
ncbi:unnamed protein product [Anisakis simplex]|uniref:Reverse transcriptase n=1 Tax=Anisakis simplex TaxID=6269 RepID=A0A0M3K4U3_ANISI|nr:unnamed protein product [Anisakis simplex]